MEQRDVDRLAVGADDAGAVTLEVRNEAVETHYLNHLELLSVEHAADEAVFPAQDKRLFAVGGLRPFTRATDRTGRDVRALLGGADGAAYVTADALLDDARRGMEAAFAPARADGALSEADVAALAAPWAAFRESIHALVGHERAGRFGML